MKPNTSALREDDSSEGLGNRVHLGKIDKLRELGIGPHIALPSLVAVGDQSAGKSSVLEGITGFSFPRAVDLCTRYATQITCRRDKEKSIEISIIPRQGASKPLEAKLRAFRRKLTDETPMDLEQVFRDANETMGIRMKKPHEDATDDDSAELVTFSEDILKVEISGPSESHLTVIDVPGIFRNTDPPFTTDSDVELVRRMVQSYMKDSRTIILAVMSANIDIDTQEILKLAKESDPLGQRTIGVLTNLNLLTEDSPKQRVVDLVLGKRNKLSLGYFLVKNRGADDTTSSLGQRNSAETAEFRKHPWSALLSTDRLGIHCLRSQLSDLLTDISKKEFPSVKLELEKSLKAHQHNLRLMGQPRDTSASQRGYLVELSSEFQRIVGFGLSANYTEHSIFDDPYRRLVTVVSRRNEFFAKEMATRGHLHAALEKLDPEEKSRPDVAAFEWENLSSDRMQETSADIRDIIDLDPPSLEDPMKTNIMDHIKEIYNNRGPELAAYGVHMLSAAFKKQPSKWEGLTIKFVSDAIFFVHLFIRETFEQCCPEVDVRTELWGKLLEELRPSYQRAMDRARFLLKVERECWPSTENHYFNDTRFKLRAERIARDDQTGKNIVADLRKKSETYTYNKGTEKEYKKSLIPTEALDEVKTTVQRAPMSNVEQVYEDIHDDLKSYYKVARKRYVDNICREVVLYMLLQDQDGPLRIFSASKMATLSEEELNNIAGEDGATRRKRRTLTEEIALFEEGVKVMRG